MKMLTKQQVFDKVKKHLLKQNERSIKKCDGETSCQYRLQNIAHGKVLKCAAGCLIPKKLYDKKMEEKSTDSLYVEFPQTMALCGLSVEVEGLVRRLQRLHDNDPVETWKTELKKVARDFQLKF